jgi:ethanolamine utilization protein EutA (predicted chaperonin)
VLALMTDMEEKPSGDFLFDLQYIRANVGQLAKETAALVEALNNLGDQGYQALTASFQRIIKEVEDVLEQRREIQLEQMSQRLVLFGKLTLYTKQLDMVLFSEGIVDWYIKDFIREHVTVKA